MSKLALILSLFVSAGRMNAQHLERIDPPTVPKSPVVTQVIKAGKLIFIGGQIGATADGKIRGSGMAEQLDQALTNLAAALKSQGADFTDVAQMTTYVTSI